MKTENDNPNIEMTNDIIGVLKDLNKLVKKYDKSFAYEFISVFADFQINMIKLNRYEHINKALDVIEDLYKQVDEEFRE